MLTDVPEGAACTLEEIFGPVVIETFATEEEAVTRANRVPYGLAASSLPAVEPGGILVRN